jgi:hypothetical protein
MIATILSNTQNVGHFLAVHNGMFYWYHKKIKKKYFKVEAVQVVETRAHNLQQWISFAPLP